MLLFQYNNAKLKAANYVYKPSNFPATFNLARTNGTLNEALLNWLDWARKKVDWYDPHMEAYDELLNEVNKATLTV